jgi:peptide/nickel transport system substrate-binding protein
LSEGYWVRQRLRRRRFLAGILGASAGALAFAAGCRTGTEESSLPERHAWSDPVNTTDSARPGLTLKTSLVSDAPSFDPLSSGSQSTHTQIAAYTYPRLLKFSTAIYPLRANGSVEGDLVESYEVSPDRLQLTLKLRQGLKWEQKAPIGGRAIDAGDVLFSWKKFSEVSPFRTDLVYHQDMAPGSPFLSVSSPDPRTVVFKLRQPDSSALGLLASDRHLYVLPKEAESGFDSRTDIRGYGPWLLADNRPGTLRAWTKNPDYYVKGRPFPDRLEQTIVGDYANRLADLDERGDAAGCDAHQERHAGVAAHEAALLRDRARLARLRLRR